MKREEAEEKLKGFFEDCEKFGYPYTEEEKEICINNEMHELERIGNLNIEVIESYKIPLSENEKKEIQTHDQYKSKTLKYFDDVRNYLFQYDIVVMAANSMYKTNPFFCRPIRNLKFDYWFEWKGTARQYAYFVYKLSVEAYRHGKSIYKGRGSFDLHRFSLIFPTIENYNNPQIDRKYLNELKDNKKYNKAAPPKGYLFIDKAIKHIF